MPKMSSDLYRTLVLTILAGLAVLIMSVANHNVYSKEVVDSKLQAIDAKSTAIEKQADHIEEDVRWIVRKMGGTPSVETRHDSDSPQPD